MKQGFLLLGFAFWLPVAAAQQSTPPPAVQPSSSQTQANEPQAWPPAEPPVGPARPASPQEGIDVPAPKPPSGQIELDVFVSDKAGNPVSGLTRGDFTLLDNDRPAEIQSFRAYESGTQPPDVQVVLVIDAVNIGFHEISYSRFGIDEFLRRNGGRLAAPTTILWYTDTGLEGGEAPTTDGNALAAKLDATQGQLRSLTRTAGAWGAIERFEMSLQTLDRIVQAARQGPGRKLLIWIGPGWPMLDSPNMQMTWKDQQHMFHNIVGLSTMLREAHMSIYSVTPGMPNEYTFLYEGYLKGVKKASQVNLPDLDLKVLAVESGGRVLSPSNDLAAEIEQCARDVGPYYTIGFTPPRADGPDEYHELKVRVDRPGLTARTNTGYYNQPPGRQLP